MKSLQEFYKQMKDADGLKMGKEEGVIFIAVIDGEVHAYIEGATHDLIAAVNAICSDKKSQLSKILMIGAMSSQENAIEDKFEDTGD